MAWAGDIAIVEVGVLYYQILQIIYGSIVSGGSNGDDWESPYQTSSGLVLGTYGKQERSAH